LKIKRKSHPSNSIVQTAAEKGILKQFNKKLGLILSSQKLQIDGVIFNVDGFSEKKGILCEIYSHIGALKAAQKNKVTHDILKMVLIEKLKRKKMQKYYLFVDKEAKKSYLNGKAWASKTEKVFNVRFEVIKISKTLRSKILNAQKKQYR
jgi:hypothetical protein